MTFEVIEGVFRYPQAPAPILDDVNFRGEAGELLAVLGPNGAGKTTLMRTMIGLLQWTSGRTEVDGVDLRDIPKRKARLSIAYVPQARSAVSLSLTGLDMVTLGRAPHLGVVAQPGPKEAAMAWEVMSSIGVEHLAHMPCGTMSGGQFQMVLIARALVAQPKVLVLDEPETGLDFHNQLVVLNLLERLVKEDRLTVVMNTHYPAHALRVADQVILVDSAHRSVSGPVSEVMTQENLARVFDVEVKITTIDSGRQKIPTVTATNLL